MDKLAVKKYIAVIERACCLIKEAIAEESDVEAVIEELLAVPPKPVLAAEEDLSVKVARAAHIKALMDIDCWPPAVPIHLIANPISDKDQANRANAVLDMTLRKSIEGQHFLDFGCGDGWIAHEALKRGAATSTGFDLTTTNNWSKLSGVNLTTNFQELPVNHFDVIFLYDVLDHTEDPMGVLKQVRHVVKQDGIIHIRNHPWTARHASHLYKGGLNKAYIHLFLTWEELLGLGHSPLFVRNELNPLEAYRWWLHDFVIEKEHIIRETVSEFFLVPSFMELVIQQQKLIGERQQGFFKDMQIQFVDFVVRP